MMKARAFFVGIAVVLVALVAGIASQAAFDAQKQSAPPHHKRLTDVAQEVDRTSYITPFEVEVQIEVEKVAAYLAAVEEERIERERVERTEREEAQRQAVRAVPQRVGGGSEVVEDGDVWWQLALCESGGRQDAYNPAGPYLSYFQWLLSTWRSLGGPGDPRDSSYEVQVGFAQALQARSGFGQWPACARKLGLL